jgi:PAS domain S-box-containing protein
MSPVVIISVIAAMDFGACSNYDTGQYMALDNLAVVLRDREQELSAIYENVPGIVFYIKIEPDGEFRFLSVSRDFLVATGLPREQIVGSLVRDIIPPPSRDMVLNHYREAILSHQTVRWEEESVYPAGRRYGEVAVTPLYDAGGVATHLIGIVHDITGRRRLEESLRESEEHLRLAMSGGNIGFWEWDVNSGQTTWSRELEEIFGLDHAGSYEAFSSRVHPDDLAAIESERDAGVRNHKPFDLEFRILLPSGEIRWLCSRGRGQYDEKGRIVRVVGFNMDITERIRAQETLREREQRLRFALEASRAGSWSRDARTGRVDWDDRFREIYGLPPEEPASFEVWLSRVHEEDRREQIELVDQIEQTNTHDTFDSTFRIVRPDGTIAWIQSLGQAHRDAEGKLTRLTGLELDITARKRAEEALHEADRRKNEFLAILGHELRNPLAALSMGLQLARRKDEIDPTLKRNLDVMDRQASQLTRLVDDLLDVARISTGKIALKLQPITLSHVLANSMEEARVAIESRDHEVLIQIQPGRHAVRGDSARLTQAIANLIENAAKYTEPGGQIRLSLEQEDGAEVVRVEDNGIGIPAAELNHVFDLFSQVRIHQGKSSGGLGIGLAIVRTLVELHGGTVEAASGGPLCGSTFTVRLPAVLEEATLTADPDVVPLDRLKGNQSRRRVLIVDDNQDAAATLAEFLELDGHQTWIAHGGLQAIEIAKATELDVVLMDLGMPGLDGIETAKRIKALPGLAGLRIAALTGWGQESDRARTREAGLDWHLVKPVNTRFLSDLITKLEPMRTAKAESRI